MFIVIFLGDSRIHAADCSKKQFNSHEKVEMTLREFLEYWKTFGDGLNLTDFISHYFGLT